MQGELGTLECSLWVGDTGVCTPWGMMLFIDVTGAPLPWLCWITDALNNRWSHNVSRCKIINPSSKSQQARCCCRPGWDCAGLRCTGLAADGCSCQIANSEPRNKLSDEDKQSRPDCVWRQNYYQNSTFIC